MSSSRAWDTLSPMSPAAVAAALLLAAAGSREAPASPAPAGPGRLVMIDPGHSPAHPGALSVRGVPEVAFNDAFAALLAERLRAAGFRVALTRAPGEEQGLAGRTARAAEHGAWLLLSIHHDSAQPQLLVEEERQGVRVHRTARPIRGHSLFVSAENPRFEASLRVARALGRRLAALGRPPTLHHAEAIPGEGRPLLDPALGIYRFDGLKVLAGAPCAAVLVELGVIVDEVDEAWVADPARREELAGAVVDGLRDVDGP